MKKTSMKFTAILLSLLMVISLIPTTGLTVEAAAKPKLAKKSVSIVIGETSKIKVKNAPKSAKITYKSTKKNIATVSKKGKVKGIKSGTSKITISVKKNSKTTKLIYKVTVKKPKLFKSKLALKTGKTYNLSVKNKSKKAKYTWTSSNSRVATVNKNGKVTAKTKGIVTIKVKVKTAKKIYILSCKMNVKSASDDSNDEKQTYTVTFNSNGGSSVASQTVQKNARATKPTDPTRSGYTFDGWYTTASGGQKFDFNTAITGNMTLYAHWTEISSEEPTPTPVTTYTVTFNSNGGSSVASQTVQKNTWATKPTDPIRSGYTFGGWYTTASGGQKFDFNTTITGNITLYAKWTNTVSQLSINTEPFLYDSTTDEYYLLDKLESLNGTLTNVSTVDALTYAVYDKDGHQIDNGNIDVSNNWESGQIGLVPGKNRIVVTATSSSGQNTNEINLYDPLGLNFDAMTDYNKDSDGDGLCDYIEDQIGTDKSNPDTDGDMLTDYQESVVLGYDPMKPDTDGNGVSDVDEDADGDGLTNSEEYRLGWLDRWR